ncbi:acyl-CoA/acyl-ACP dehydrogenase [Streptomyces sp. HNM0663]|uniref:Acyl-CoA/acyl-ACP dehydrogenase n=1 Tax=Streptomyces chengmaiensis TaxID=3040919 RepID=A0ABT6HNR4_9ACTN|nr:acyl-CoA/acyl-ACP dehydrogenase [Streptomyces chengmaiensis]MDH2389965.1 acyl-CoA/acyl-ACP dehydrogenase [Streptomyces chengmaiensis]
MRFLLTGEQTAFARSLDAMLTAADTPGTVRAWAAGDFAAGRMLWSRLAEAGVFALAVPEAYEGLGPRPVDLAVAFVELGRHAAPGPYVETAGAAALLSALAELGDPAPAKRLLPPVAAGSLMPTLTLHGAGPYALDADAADCVLAVGPVGSGGAATVRLAPAGRESPQASADPARRLGAAGPGGPVLATGPQVAEAARRAVDWARLAAAAQCLGVGLALLDRTVAYVKQRTQFGAAIGSFQAVKHRLSDTLIALEFARPLVYGAAVTMTRADVSAAKAAAGEAAYAAARTALQLHGAIGYTDELDLSLWLRKARPLRDAWGTPARCRADVLSTPDAAAPDAGPRVER